MRPVVRARLFLFVATLVGAAGCGSGPAALPPDQAEAELHRSTMQEVGEMLMLHKTNSGGKPVTKATELAKYENAFQRAYYEVRDNNIVVFWNIPISESASNAILAYEKQTPDSGGYVLMQDGSTIKKLTAEEFKAAPKPDAK